MTIANLHEIYGTESDSELLEQLMLEVKRYKLTKGKVYILAMTIGGLDYKIKGKKLLGVFAEAIAIQDNYVYQ